MHYKKRKLFVLYSIPIWFRKRINSFSKSNLCNKEKLYLVSYSIPLSCMVVLLLTGIFAINPSLSLKTSAVTIQDEWVVNENNSSSDSGSLVSENDNTSESADPVDDSFGGFGGNEVELSQEDMDAGISPMSIVASPTLAITVSNSNQTIDAVQGGNTVYGSYNVGITGSNVKDYTLSIKADAVNLVSPSQASTPTTITGAGGKTGDSMNANTWGYKLTETSTAESSYGTLNYASLPTSLTQIANGTVASPYNLSANKKLVFAAKFSDTAAPGTYKGHITLSAVANQAVVGAIWSSGVDSGITDMQDVSSGFCKNNSKIVVGDTIILKDNRGGYASNTMTGSNGIVHGMNQYVVVKLRDGNCWMQENLRLRAAADTGLPLTSGDTNISDSWILPKTLVGSGAAVPDWKYNATNPYSAAFNNSLYGVYYNWCAATATTCSDLTSSGQAASGSICPKGWQIPSGGYNGFFYSLLNSLDVPTVTTLPYSFLLSGQVGANGVGSNLADIGELGYYWTRTLSSSETPYLMAVHSYRIDPGTTHIGSGIGASVRCVADY